MSDAIRYAVPRMRMPSDLPNGVLTCFPGIGVYFEFKAIEIVNKNIKELIKEEKRSVTINYVPQMRHFINLEREIYTSGRYRDLFTIALVVAAFVIGYFPLILALFFSAIFGFAVFYQTAYIAVSDRGLSQLKGRNTIPDSLLHSLCIN